MNNSTKYSNSKKSDVLLKDIILIVLDEKANYDSEITQSRLARGLFQSVILVQNKEEFISEYDKLDLTQRFVFICHVFHADEWELKGYIRLKSYNIEEEFNIKAVLVSSGDNGKVMQDIWQKERDRRVVYLYSAFREELKAGKLPVYTKSELDGGNSESEITSEQTLLIPCQIGIITALYQDEFEEVEKLFTWLPDQYVTTRTKRYRIGHLNGQPDVRVVAAVPSATGMVDSAIVATQMLDWFKPKYLIMTGVCGGKEKLKFGSIILASKIFTFQKGKVSTVMGDDRKEIELFDQKQQLVDYHHLYDNRGNQVKVDVEKFEVEQDSIIEIDPVLKDILDPHLKNIEEKINEPYQSNGKKVNVIFEPMACSTMVINKSGYFEEKVKSVDRKIVAVEMESYGVARASKFANNGDTKFIICKSVMDNLSNKSDSKKRFAAYTSAQFLRHLLYDKILPL